MSLHSLDHGARGAVPASRPIATPRRGQNGLNLAGWAVWLVAAYVVATAGLLAALLFQLRTEAVGAAKRELAAFAQLTAGHTFEVALGLEEALKLVEVTLSVTAGSAVADEEQMRLMLRDVAANTRSLKDILVLDSRGRVVYQASGRADIGLDWSDRPAFQQFQRNAGLKFDIGVAARRAGGAADWFIPVTHAWRRNGTELAGVIVGIMDPQYFDKAWTFDSEIAGLSIALSAADGTLIMRRPFAAELVGRPLADTETLGGLSAGRAADSLQMRNPADGQTQLLAYRRVAAYPNLLILVAQPLDVALAGWWRVVGIVGSSWLVASLALGGLGAWLAREMRARGALETRYHALFNAIPHPVIVADRDSQRIIALNDATVRQYGWATPDMAAGSTGAELPETFALLAAGSQDFSRDTATVIQGQRHRNRDGNPIDVELTVRLIDYNGKPATLTIAVDVSDRLKAERERRAAEEQLRQSQKMDVLGQLTGGIAHDFNNILMVIIDAVEAVGEREAADPEIGKGLARIADAAQRAEDLTRQMLAFSRKQPLRPRPLNLNDLVADTGKLLRRTLGGQIEIESILADEVWPVEVDPAQLETSLVNLCLNARDAMPKGGRVLIETQNVTRQSGMAAFDPGVPEGDFVLIAVSDTGHGILPQDLDKVFEPFFTTKASGKGSGLGLSMVYGFVKQSHGHIVVTSEVDRGTVFRIWLPRHSGAVASAAATASAPVVGGNERVLVVEDDPLVRASVVRQLQSLGYAVQQAENGPTGLAAYEAARPPFDLVLTDVVMPGGMNGKQLADAIVQRRPGAVIVFMSGFTDNALTTGGAVEADVHLLSKPFRKSDLAGMLRRALEKGGSHG